KKFLLRWVVSLVVLFVLLVICNGIAQRFDRRVDLTRAGVHTVSAETGRILAGLEESITIEYWVSEKMPSGLQNLRRDTVDYLDEFQRAASAAGARVEILVKDPNRVIEAYVQQKEEAGEVPETDPMQAFMGGPVSPADEKKRELAQQGIPELQGRSLKDDGFEIVPFYSALLLKYLDREQEGIPVHSNLEGLEYELVSRIVKLSMRQKPVIAFFHGRPEDQISTTPDGRPLPQPTGHFSPFIESVLMGRFEVVPIDLSEQNPVPEEAVILIVAEPDGTTARQRYEIERFIADGRPVIFFASTTAGKLDQTVQMTPLAPGLEETLQAWGIQIQPHMLVASDECGSITIMQNTPLGPMQRPAPLKLCPMATGNGLDGTSPLTRGIGSIVFPFASPLIVNETVAATAGLEVTVLARSVRDSWLAPFSPSYTLQMRDKPKDPGSLAPRNLALLIEGVFPTTFEEGSAVPPWDPTAETDGGSAPTVGALDARSSRVLLIGSADIAKYGSLIQYRQNVQFLLGAIEALALDPDLATIRSKVQVSSALRDTSRQERRLASYGNMVGIPLLLLVFYMVLVARRHSSAQKYESQFLSKRRVQQVEEVTR
ncbi:MAG: GldG family protein, partial [Planctomycetes bacterium]|nr:GldG family protein [Planctomycetota bacterium]